MKLLFRGLIPLLVLMVGLAHSNQIKHLTWIPSLTPGLDLNTQEGSGYSQENFRYVARAAHEGGVVCGQYLPESQEFQSAWQGAGLNLPGNVSQLLRFMPGTVTWLPRGTEGGGDGEEEVPHNLVVCGRMPGTGEHSYACRTIKEMDVSVGYFLFSTQKCVTIHDNAQVESDKFELLSLNLYGIVSGAAWPS